MYETREPFAWGYAKGSLAHLIPIIKIGDKVVN